MPMMNDDAMMTMFFQIGRKELNMKECGELCDQKRTESKI